jgi:hypothetical protein
MNIFTYQLTYLLIKIALIFCAAWWMHRTGRILLSDTLSVNPELANSVNRSIGIGYFLCMFGYLVITETWGQSLFSTPAIIPQVGCVQIGFLCWVLGVMHFLHIFIVSRLVSTVRRSTSNRDSMLA